MIRSFSYIFGFILKFWFNIVGNYGWAVILFSITIKAILFPLTLKQQKSTKKTQELQPKLQEIQEKYKDDQQKFMQEYQKFVKENDYHPMGGCLLAIVQMFVIFGVLYVVINPMKYMDKMKDAEIDEALQKTIIDTQYSGDKEAFESYVVSFINENSGDSLVKKATQNTSGDDEILTYVNYYKLRNRYYEIDILKNKYEPEKLTIFGIFLGDITVQNMKDWKLWVFPVLTTIFYYLSLAMVTKKQKTQPKMKDADGNEIEMPDMRTMNITMPILSGWISASVPQGMGLYWFTNSFLQIIIQYVTQKFLDKGDKNNSSTEVVIEAENLENTVQNPIVEEKKNNNNGKNKNSSKKKKKNKK